MSDMVHKLLSIHYDVGYGAQVLFEDVFPDMFTYPSRVASEGLRNRATEGCGS